MTQKPITKAELARRFGVDRSQATLWARKGMPVRADGLLDPDVAERWVRANIDPTWRVMHPSRAKVVRSSRPRREAKPIDEARFRRMMRCAMPEGWQPRDEPRTPDEALVHVVAIATGVTARFVAASITEWGLEVGLSDDAAEKLQALACERVLTVADQSREWMGIDE